MPTSLVTVVVPIYKEEPSALEKISLAQTLTVLQQYRLTFIAPPELDTRWYETYCQGKVDMAIERFAWQGWQGYAELMMDPAFYQRFLAYEYMLICQLDAFVFRDELTQWCQRGYDYVGAVIYSAGYEKPKKWWRTLLGLDFPAYVGAGGLCLKKNRSFYRLNAEHKGYIHFFLWLSRVRRRIFLDDIFVSMHYPRLDPAFRIAPRTQAEEFGADYNNWDEAKLPFTNRDNDTLPFGVHAWIQYHPDFWKPCIRRYGYAL